MSINPTLFIASLYLSSKHVKPVVSKPLKWSIKYCLPMTGGPPNSVKIRRVPFAKTNNQKRR